MKVTYKVGEDCVLEVEVKDSKQAFQFMSVCDTVFGVKECGNCGCRDLSRRYKRTPEGYEYYSIECQNEDCKYEYKFGQAKEGGQLFPKGWHPPFQKQESGGGHNHDSANSYHDQYSRNDPPANAVHAAHAGQPW